jgi:hypothetical protein
MSAGPQTIADAAHTITLQVARQSDPDGNGIVLRPTAILEGQTTPGAVVQLDRNADGTYERSTRADMSGRFAFRVGLAIGRIPFRVQIRGGSGPQTQADIQVTRGDVVIAWNKTLLDAVRADATGPPQAARAMAMTQIAVYDAVGAAIGRASPRGPAPPAAAAQAAHRVLSGLFPAQRATFDASLAESLASIPHGCDRALGRRLGAAAGDAMLASRVKDGSDVVVDYNPGSEPGNWVPTPPGYQPPLAPQWPGVRPFVMSSGSQFRPGPPPALTDPEYTAAYNEVKAVGGVVSDIRTTDQTELAKFWADLPGMTFTPPGHWNQIAQDAALHRRFGLARNARLFAMLNAALADAGISCWDAKYHYDFWRPVTAIHAGDQDGNPETIGDPNWMPLWDTPNFSAYTSGHSTFSGAAQVVLESFFGRDFAFSDRGDPSLGLPERRFSSLAQAAEEAGMSRIYGGIHFQFDNVEGLRSGRELGAYVVSHFGRRMGGLAFAALRRFGLTRRAVGCEAEIVDGSVKVVRDLRSDTEKSRSSS